MFLDAVGLPKEVTPENLNGYEYNLHGVMLLTSADKELYMPPKWHGTLYSTESILTQYCELFNPDMELLTLHPLTPYEPELICCERKVVEISAMSAGRSVTQTSDIAAFLLLDYVDEKRTLITKELNRRLNIFPTTHPYHARNLAEGIDFFYFDGELYKNDFHKKQVHGMLKILTPKVVKDLEGTLWPHLCKP